MTEKRHILSWELLLIFYIKIETKNEITIIITQFIMTDCYTNCDFNATVIDDWQRQTYKQRQQEAQELLKSDRQYNDTMKKIRLMYICNKCYKYPGDHDYLNGINTNMGYVCFDCL